MSATLRLLLGRAGTGKTARIVEALKARQQAGERAILIVPEQYTYESERLLADALGGLVGIQVFSFDRLCERVLSLGGRTRPLLSDQGYRMVIRRAIDRRQESLRVFSLSARQAGFVEEAQSFFRDVKRAGLSPDVLDALLARLPEGLPLKEKLLDLSMLYRETEEYLFERYLSLDDAANEAARLLPASFVAELPVYIDGLDRPNRQVLNLLEQMLLVCPEVTVSLRVDAEPCADAELFDPEREVLRQILRIADKRSVGIREEWLSRQVYSGNPLMRHIERNLFAYPAEAFEKDASHLTIFGASDRRAETESLAEAILEFARNGVRYRDMAVIVSDLDAYAALISRSCARRGIPVFLDRKRPLTGHAAIDGVLGAVRFCANGYAANELQTYCKSGFAPCEDADAEALDLYLRRTGARGSALLRPLTRANPEEAAERARAAVVPALERLSKGLSRATVGEQVRALYTFLAEIDLQRALEKKAEALGAQGRLSLMQEHAQVWNLLVELLDQTSEILGELKIGKKGFVSLLEEGLNGYSVGVVPGTADQGLVGDVVRTRSRRVRALFVVGANDGLLPRPQQNDGLFDDGEIRELRGLGAELKKTAAELTAADRLDLYTALSKTGEFLYVSYAFGDGSGELAPSPLVERLQAICPTCRRKTDIERSDALPDCAAEALTLCAADLRRYRDEGKCTQRLPALVEWLSGNEETRQLTGRILQESEARFGPAAIRRETAEKLYGASVAMSASRLESFNSCPFQHFVRYGLRAEETREYTERAADLGEFYHAALEAFVRAVGERNMDWRTFTDAEALSLLDELLPEVIANHNYGILVENERMRATVFLLVEVVRQSALAILHQIRAGSFTPERTEVRFGAGAPFPPIRLRLADGREALIGGKIDRVDCAKVNGRKMTRIIDYKTGGRDFDFAGVLSGLTLQLPLYLLAAAEHSQERAGLYYMPILQPVVSDAEEDIEAAAQDAFRLKGLTLSDASVIQASDGAINGASGILGGVKSVGEDAYSGSVCSEAELGALLEAARKKSEETLRCMLEGEMTASPAARQKRKQACLYCDYNSVCRFDQSVPGARARLLKSIRQDDFFQLINGGDEHALDE
ncbi:MAG: PD-(D/E)XK nuclease family protein [Eubacteriales bacterium]|nr:PD-(D/E)XK nuclease family protein [Eubacteriales bacterium]